MTETTMPIQKAGFLPRLLSAVMPRVKPFSEMGVSGTPVYAGYVLTAERSPKLIGQEKYRTFSNILANTSIVAAGTRYFLNIVAKPSWSVTPADDSDQAKQYAEFVEQVLLEDLATPWSRVVRRCGTYRFHGFALQEWTAKRREDGRIGFDDIESRPQWTIWRWEVDERGTVVGAWQRDPLTGRELGLPRNKLMYLVDDTLTDSPEGMGLLRHCVETSERLGEYERQEGFGFLRDLHGVPVGRAPMEELSAAVAAGNITEGAKNNAIDTLRSFCSMEKKNANTAIILSSQPYSSFTDSGQIVAGQAKWGVELLGGGAPGLQFVGESIVRLNQEMARILGVEHLLLGADAAGSYALAKEKATDLYLLANSVLRDIKLQAQHDLLWPLWSLNGFPDEMMPELNAEDVQPRDVEMISRVMRDMATAGAPMQPDDEVQNFVRELLGAPTLNLDELRQRMQDQQAMQVQQMQQLHGAGGPDQMSPAQEDRQDKIDAEQQKAQKILVSAVSQIAQLRKGANGKPNGNEVAASRLWDVVAKAQTVLERLGKDFDPNQPRDADGQWTAEGGGGESETKGGTDSPKAPKLTQSLRSALDDMRQGQITNHDQQRQMGQASVLIGLAIAPWQPGAAAWMIAQGAAMWFVYHQAGAEVYAKAEDFCAQAIAAAQKHFGGDKELWSKAQALLEANPEILTDKQALASRVKANADKTAKLLDIKKAFDPHEARDPKGRWSSGGAAEQVRSARQWLRSKNAAEAIRRVARSERARGVVSAALQGMVSAAQHQHSDPVFNSVIEHHVEHVAVTLGLSKERAKELLRQAVVVLRAVRGRFVSKGEADPIADLLKTIAIGLEPDGGEHGRRDQRSNGAATTA